MRCVIARSVSGLRGQDEVRSDIDRQRQGGVVRLLLRAADPSQIVRAGILAVEAGGVNRYTELANKDAGGAGAADKDR